MSNARVWLFRSLILIAIGLLFVSWFLPWWKCTTPAMEGWVRIRPWGLENNLGIFAVRRLGEKDGELAVRVGPVDIDGQHGTVARGNHHVPVDHHAVFGFGTAWLSGVCHFRSLSVKKPSLTRSLSEVISLRS